MTWLLLIYTLPAEPSRKRAFVWRELKKCGAVYLRDGVCALPEEDAALEAFRAIAAKVEDFGGVVTLVEGATLNPERERAVVEASRRARAEEYREIAREADALFEHMRRETEHRDLGFHELEQLEGDVGKLKRWAEQVQARDHFRVPDREQVAALLRQCDEAVASFLVLAYRQDQGRS